MTVRAGRPLARVLAEALVIVGSILLAFWIDALWDRSQEREREREYVAALSVEMELAASELAEDNGRRELRLSMAQLILQQVERRTVPDDTINVWIQEVSMLLTRFFAPSAVLTDLVSSGNLSLLTSQELRSALLTYDQRRERVNYLEDFELAAAEDGLRPYLTERFRWTEMEFLPLEERGMLPGDPMEPVPLTPGMLDRVLADPVFRNLMLIKRQRLMMLQRRSRELTEVIEDVIAVLDREADRLGVEGGPDG